MILLWDFCVCVIISVGPGPGDTAIGLLVAAAGVIATTGVIAIRTIPATRCLIVASDGGAGTFRYHIQAVVLDEFVHLLDECVEAVGIVVQHGRGIQEEDEVTVGLVVTLSLYDV